VFLPLALILACLGSANQPLFSGVFRCSRRACHGGLAALRTLQSIGSVSLPLVPFLLVVALVDDGFFLVEGECRRPCQPTGSLLRARQHARNRLQGRVLGLKMVEGKLIAIDSVDALRQLDALRRGEEPSPVVVEITTSRGRGQGRPATGAGCSGRGMR
jgi:hypothetical protein